MHEGFNGVFATVHCPSQAVTLLLSILLMLASYNNNCSYHSPGLKLTQHLVPTPFIQNLSTLFEASKGALKTRRRDWGKDLPKS